MRRINFKTADALSRSWAYSISVASRTRRAAGGLQAEICGEYDKGCKSLRLGYAGNGLFFKVENDEKSILVTKNLERAVEKYNSL